MRKKQGSKKMEIGEIVEWVRIFLEGEYATGEIYDQLDRIAIIHSQTGSLAKFVYHDKKYNPRARKVGTHKDETSIAGEAMLHLIALMILRRIDIYDALETGMKRLEDKDGEKKKGKIVKTKKIVTLKGIRAASGIVEGIAIVMQFVSEKEFEKLPTYVKDEEKILVTESLSADSVSVGFLRAMNLIGIVTNQGGNTSHGAMVAREFEIPCVSGTEKATEIIHTGDKIIVDGNKGEVVLRRR